MRLVQYLSSLPMLMPSYLIYICQHSAPLDDSLHHFLSLFTQFSICDYNGAFRTLHKLGSPGFSRADNNPSRVFQHLCHALRMPSWHNLCTVGHLRDHWRQSHRHQGFDRRLFVSRHFLSSDRGIIRDKNSPLVIVFQTAWTGAVPVSTQGRDNRAGALRTSQSAPGLTRTVTEEAGLLNFICFHINF